jgi:Cu(I)/Ag(I) efflux system membrane fusion protein
MRYRIPVILFLSFIFIQQAVASSEAVSSSFLGSIVTPYLEIQTGLAADDVSAAQKGASAFTEAVEGASVDQSSEATTRLLEPARRILEAADLDSAREAFAPLSNELRTLAEKVGVSSEKPIYIAYCPMASNGKGGHATWLQNDKTIMNPYHGSGMLHCGVIEKQIQKQ